ncbi:DUF4279 domain-containing protein [Achromobacter mucicolens]|uniref:DUF4279 domain-containing protein n=1 Tax=Achromobacter mucicolens TaxID=1389922 RepID=UPI002446F2BD|nr:DUF4279 domain-containing protein [Achromobacter mucicolens]MDH1523663.1 DUF4279 domain-containing protein [Achromobacter mucicolens]
MNLQTRITPVAPDYESCAECYARLMIYPGGRHPDVITDIFHIQPTSVNVVGDVITNSRGRKRQIKNSGWFLSTEGLVLSKDIRQHIGWLVKIIYPRRHALKEIQNMDEMKITLKCVWFSLLGHSGPVLWPEQMKALAELDLECSFDIYFVNQ